MGVASMTSHLLNLDIHAKLPIIRADSVEKFQRQCLENGVRIHRSSGIGGDEEDSRLTTIDDNNGLRNDDELSTDSQCRLTESRIHDRNFRFPVDSSCHNN